MHRPLAVSFAATLLSLVSAQALSEADITTVTQNLATGAQQSWELGTRAQSLLDLYVPNFSVFSSTGLPPSASVPSNTTSALAPVFSIAKNVVSALKLNSTSGPSGLVGGDGAAGDPASIGVAVLLANWTGQGSGDGVDYAKAAQSQLEYTLNVVPRTSDGAISHRVAQVQLWSDSVFMVPPFLAYYGVLTGNTTLLTEAYNQIKLYRNYLRDTDAKNLWKHIVLGNNTQDGPNDDGHWSTGNGWAAAGMLRVIATMKNSPYSKDFSSQQKDLASWVKEIHTAMFANIDSTNIFTNYADKPASSDMFYDTASTSLIASTVYRAALLLNDHSHLPNAEKCREALFATSNSSSSSNSTFGRRQAGDSSASHSASASASRSASRSSGASSVSPSSTAPLASPSATTAPLSKLAHFTDDGWLTPVVNPHQFGVQGQNSPEGQAFVLELQAAYNEWVASGSPGANAAGRTASAVVGWAWVAGCVVVGSLLAYA
ncbi:Six-hairpin glycosidase-like protein [Mycena albidolilacea]|uniref:Six-hairpin glycosidase-like protein n=1 Tax=Mycena albidolilacea TaxID=1033008 RepID=A0AAD7EP12_9AGAR|nr:Six-hairpin glycosidase-like protein [Mycena albidolilacea]